MSEPVLNQPQSESFIDSLTNDLVKVKNALSESFDYGKSLVKQTTDQIKPLGEFSHQLVGVVDDIAKIVAVVNPRFAQQLRGYRSQADSVINDITSGNLNQRVISRNKSANNKRSTPTTANKSKKYKTKKRVGG